ncbi:MAG: ABC transporter permease [Candidatus Handelsmanbacteria bacterium]|nr:ABC transporter permease [Candidatus Handelsmanbacteria bacterium]
MRISEVYLVAQREYLENLRTKAFWIGILTFPLIITLGICVPILLARAKEARSFAVLDHSGFLLRQVEEQAAAQDLAAAFSRAAEAYRRGGPAFAELPEALRGLALGLLPLEETQRGKVIEALVRGEAPADTFSLPEPARALLARREALLDWRQQVSAAELKDLDFPQGRYRRVEVPQDGSDPQARLNQMVAQGEIFAYFVIGPDPVAGPQDCKYVSRNLTDTELHDWFSGLATAAIRQQRLIRANLDPRTAQWVQAPLEFAGRRLDEGGAEQRVAFGDKARQWVPLAFVYLLWFAVFTSAQMLLNSTIEEKSSRVVEVLLSSVDAGELMAGKIAGTAASGLTVVGSWAVFISLAVAIVPGLLGASATAVAQIIANPFYLASFVVYFCLGYLFYAALLVSIGSMCNSLQETQNLMMPILIPMMIPLFAMVPLVQDPNGLLARVLSFIPPFTPFVMMNRAAGPPAPWEYLVTALLMVGSIALATWAAARIFRIGILLTGKRPRLREIWGWLRSGEAR